MKKFLLLLLFYSYSFASSIDNSLLSIHATLLPKLAFMDTNYKDKLDKDALSIVVFHSNIDLKSAQLLKEEILSKYPNGIKKHPLKITLSSYTHLKNISANIFYLLPAKKQKIKKLLKIAQRNHILTFSYLKNDLAYGSILSLNIGKKVKPVINLLAVKECNLSIRSVLLKISTIYTHKERN